jgi:hypothetical protein
LELTADDFVNAVRLAFPEAVPSGCRADDLSEVQRELLLALVGSPQFWRMRRLIRLWPKQWPQDLPRTRQGLRQALGQPPQPLTPEAALQVLEQSIQTEVAQARARRRVDAPRPRRAPGNMARTIREAAQHLAQAMRITDEDRHVSDEDRRAVEALDLTGWATDEVLAHLDRVPGLRTLILQSTDVSDAGLPHLCAVPRLVELDLGDTAVTSKGLSHLACLTKLEKLWLADTAVATADLLQLRNVLPSLAQLNGRPLPVDAPADKQPERTARQRWDEIWDDLFKNS